MCVDCVRVDVYIQMDRIDIVTSGEKAVGELIDQSSIDGVVLEEGGELM